jgi:D-beta-D-heptose 7-phosphate kinase/D-beta-D-heptose 1-phosphate adenosyltransferase
VLPNRLEASFLAGQSIHCLKQGLAVARALCADNQLDAIVLKLDADGMAVVDHRHGSEAAIPAIHCQVRDVTGAGDMVLAAMGLGLASGLTLLEAAGVANVAAALEIQRLGVTPVTREEVRMSLRVPAATAKVMDLESLAQFVFECRQAGQRIVFTNGCFDLLHIGHVSYLREAAHLGDVLIVGINSDQGVRRLKGTGRPIIREQDRAAMLAALECVGRVVIFDEETPHRLLETLRPDVLVKGGTYTREQVVGHEVVEGYGGDVKVLCLVDGVSTSRIVAAIQS